MNSGDATTRSVSGVPPQAALLDVPGSTPGISATQTVVAPPDRRLVRLQWAVALTLIALLALISVRLWFVEGLLRIVRIDGASMAPDLCGAHYRVTCDDCEFPFACDALHAPASGLVVCPNCGNQKNDLEKAELREGDRVLIDRWKLLFAEPHRGHVVAIQTAESPPEFAVKRIAALPGERLAIREGDLYLDGRTARKTLAEWRKLRQIVHDNAYQPRKTAGLPARWQGSRPDSRWKAANATLSFEPSAGEQSAMPAQGFDWLQYHHWHCTAGLQPRTASVPIRDNDSYNQDESRSALNRVDDVALSGRVRLVADGTFALAALDGHDRLEAVFEPAQKRVSIVRDGQEFGAADLTFDFVARPVEIEFGLCDQQVILAIEGRTIVRLPYERSAGPRQANLHPLAIGGGSGELEVSELKVWRDIHYLEPLETGRAWEAEQPLAMGEYALLGDNPAVSEDSRTWAAVGVPRRAILGRVYRPFWADSSESYRH